MELKDKVIYQLFLTDFTESGTFSSAAKRLPYLKELGVDLIQLLPFYPIGEKDKKGTLGSPYSIRDYEEVDPRLGTIEEAKEFIKEAHRLGIKVLFDVVFHHTSRDSSLLKAHPECFFYKQDGSLGNHVGDWNDVVDFSFTGHPDLEEYLIKVLNTYISWGADGFRFDVASMIPASFYQRMFSSLKGKDLVYVGESVDASFCNYVRSIGEPCLSNQELFSLGFNALYHYFSWENLKKYLSTNEVQCLEKYKVALVLESSAVQENGLIIRAIENHDNPRMASYRSSVSFLKNLLAYSFFSKGPAFLYNGEENGDKRYPDFFEKEPLDFTKRNEEIFAYTKLLIERKHHSSFSSLHTSLPLDYEGRILVIENRDERGQRTLGLFNLDEKPLHFCPHPSENGRYIDLLSQKEVVLKKEGITINEPMWLVEDHYVNGKRDV